MIDDREMFAPCMVLPLQDLPFDDSQGYSVSDEHGYGLFGRYVLGKLPEQFEVYTWGQK